MDFQTSVKTCLTQKYATFAGRASRSEFWWFILAYFVGALIALLLGRIVYLLYVLALIVPTTSAGWRRLQDTGRPGWYILVPVGFSLLTMLLSPAPMADPMAPGGMGGMGLMAILGIVQLILAVLYIYWLTRPSEPETNTYGPPPQA